jgi:hypothetical protein
MCIVAMSADAQSIGKGSSRHREKFLVENFKSMTRRQYVSFDIVSAAHVACTPNFRLGIDAKLSYLVRVAGTNNRVVGAWETGRALA